MKKQRVMKKTDINPAQSARREQPHQGFLGNGLSRTAMVFRIATLAGHKLTVPELNRIKDINPRA